MTKTRFVEPLDMLSLFFGSDPSRPSEFLNDLGGRLELLRESRVLEHSDHAIEKLIETIAKFLDEVPPTRPTLFPGCVRDGWGRLCPEN